MEGENINKSPEGIERTITGLQGLYKALFPDTNTTVSFDRPPQTDFHNAPIAMQIVMLRLAGVFVDGDQPADSPVEGFQHPTNNINLQWEAISTDQGPRTQILASQNYGWGTAGLSFVEGQYDQSPAALEVMAAGRVVYLADGNQPADDMKAVVEKSFALFVDSMQKVQFGIACQQLANQLEAQNLTTPPTIIKILHNTLGNSFIFELKTALDKPIRVEIPIM